MKKEYQQLTLIAGGLLAILLWLRWRDEDMLQRGGKPRHVSPPSIRGSALDNTMGQVTPDEYLFFGPAMRPPGWVPHKVRYPMTPGQELERLIYGAPMVCPTNVPGSLKGWMFEPPSEVDI